MTASVLVTLPLAAQEACTPRSDAQEDHGGEAEDCGDGKCGPVQVELDEVCPAGRFVVDLLDVVVGLLRLCSSHDMILNDWNLIDTGHYIHTIIVGIEECEDTIH